MKTVEPRDFPLRLARGPGWRLWRILPWVLLLSACVAGHWVKPGATPEQAEKALADCQSMVVQPFVDPSRKISPPPDLTMVEVEQCMKRKGFVWVPEGQVQPETEILTIPDHSNPTSSPDAAR